MIGFKTENHFLTFQLEKTRIMVGMPTKNTPITRTGNVYDCYRFCFQTYSSKFKVQLLIFHKNRYTIAITPWALLWTRPLCRAVRHRSPLTSPTFWWRNWDLNRLRNEGHTVSTLAQLGTDVQGPSPCVLPFPSHVVSLHEAPRGSTSALTQALSFDHAVLQGVPSEAIWTEGAEFNGSGRPPLSCFRYWTLPWDSRVAEYLTSVDI